MPARWPAAHRAATMGACGWPRVSPPAGSRSRLSSWSQAGWCSTGSPRRTACFRVRRPGGCTRSSLRPSRAGGRRCADCGAAGPVTRLAGSSYSARCRLRLCSRASPYAWAAFEAHPDSLPGGSWAALVSSLWPVFFAWPLAVTFLFPDGRLPSRRWRPYALFAACSMTLLVVALVLSDELESAVRGCGESGPRSIARRARVPASPWPGCPSSPASSSARQRPGAVTGARRDRAAPDALARLCDAADPVRRCLVPRLGLRGRRGPATPWSRSCLRCRLPSRSLSASP